MQSIIFDIEIYPNFFCVTIKDYNTKEVIQWEISETVNNFEQIKEFFTTYTGILFSFNGIHYDNVVLAYMILNDCDSTYSIWQFSNSIINDTIIDKKYKYFGKWINVDFFLYWSKMLRQSKKISLKALGVQMNYHTVKDLPYLNKELNLDEIDEVLQYNIYDIEITEMLIGRMNELINLRLWIYKTYKLLCFSWDAIKIASELLLQQYCEITNKNVNDVRKWTFTKTNFRIGDYLPSFNFKTGLLQSIYQFICDSGRDFSKEFVYNSAGNNIKINLGIGGIHSIINNAQYIANDKYTIVTSDVGSMYPTNLINHNIIRFPEVVQIYADIKAQRFEAKRNKDKIKDTFLKLVLNGTSGLLDNEYSWLYYPEKATALRVIGQLQILRTVEELTINGFQVLTVNTDSIDAYVEKNRLDEYYDIMSNSEKEFNITWEHDQYTKIVYFNINSYVAVTTSGKIKQKGQFVEKPELSNSVDELVIAKALTAYFIHGIPVREFINNHNNIEDFCLSKKVSKDFTVYWNGKKQQNLNRYYVSKRGAYLYYSKDNKKMNNLLKGFSVQLLNVLPDSFPTDVNKEYYIGKTMDLINPFMQQKLL